MALVGKHGGKTLLGRPRRRLQVNTKVKHQDTDRMFVDWINLAHDKDKWDVLLRLNNFRVP